MLKKNTGKNERQEIHIPDDLKGNACNWGKTLHTAQEQLSHHAAPKKPPGSAPARAACRRFLPWEAACFFHAIIRGIAKGAFFIFSAALLLSLLAFGIGFSYFKNLYAHCRQAEYDALSAIDAGTFSGIMSTVIYDKDDHVLAKIQSADFKYTKIKNISPYIQEAYISSEDQNFKSHIGVDPKGITRAAALLVKNRGTITQGGSTITQQLVKNTLLTQERTFGRKLTEIFLAIDLEKKLTKAEIMEYYLNTNFYGNGCYGVYAACMYYFNKTPDDVTPAEAAMLAGISKSPSLYNPEKSRKKAKQQRNLVLSLMKKNAVLTKKEYKHAKKAHYSLPQHESKEEKESYLVSYAVYCTALKLMEADGFSFQYLFESQESYAKYKKAYSKAYRSAADKIRTGGYDIHTSLDPGIQKQLQSAVDNRMDAVSRTTADDGRYTLQSAAVCVDNKNGYVVAIVGGRGETDAYNRGFLSTRQPGSSIKPVIDYGPAFDTKQYFPSRIVQDAPIHGGPKNSGGGYRGNVSIRNAITYSINTVAYNTLMDIGIDKGLSYLEKLRFSSLTFSDMENASISIGGFTQGVRTVDMARAFFTIENGGIDTQRTCLRKLRSVTDGIIYKDARQDNRVYEEATAYLLKSCMQDGMKHGTGKGLGVPGQDCAGKTGTTNDYKDGWFCGFTNYYTTVVWVGNDSGAPVSGNFGARYAGSIWKTFMTGLHAKKPASTFDIPESVERLPVGKYGYPAEKDEESRSMDYFAKDGSDIAKQEKLAQTLEFRRIAAESALQKFESSTIEEETDIYRAEDLYDAANRAIAAYGDSTGRAPLMRRLATKKTALDQEKQSWGALSISREAYEAQIQEQKAKEAAAAREKAAKQAAYNSASKRFDTLLGYLYKFQYRTTRATKILEQAKEVLEELSRYDGYDTHKADYEKAAAHIAALPSESAFRAGFEKKGTGKSTKEDAKENTSKDTEEDTDKVTRESTKENTRENTQDGTNENAAESTAQDRQGTPPTRGAAEEEEKDIRD